MKLGVYVGSFDPVHNGHIRIVNHLVNNYLDKVIIVPTCDYWNKTLKCSLKDRINMLKIFECDKIIIDEENNNLKYTYMVLDSLSKKYSNDELYLIIGADSIVKFDKWKEYEQILKYGIIVINRDDIDVKYYLNKLSKKDNYIITSELDRIDISSSFIRENISNKSVICNMLDDRVYQYIVNNSLYK